MDFIFLVFYIFIFLFGLCIGSFLNCVIYRLELQADLSGGRPRRKAASFLRGRSFCPKCKKQLRWYDLIPVFSFLFLRGKCSYCKKSISWQYPLVEISTAAIFLLIFNFMILEIKAMAFISSIQFSVFNFINLLFLFLVSCFLIIIFVYDLKHYIIPDKVLFPAIGIVLIYRLAEVLNFGHWNFCPHTKIWCGGEFWIWDFGFGTFAPLLNYFWAALIASGFFLAIFLLSAGRWMGFGDVKLAILMGFLLGLPNVLAALFLAFFFGGIISIILMILGKKGLKSEIPFGPFLIAGTFIAMLWGQEITNWYVRLFIM